MLELTGHVVPRCPASTTNPSPSILIQRRSHIEAHSTRAREREMRLRPTNLNRYAYRNSRNSLEKLDRKINRASLGNTMHSRLARRNVLKNREKIYDTSRSITHSREKTFGERLITITKRNCERREFPRRLAPRYICGEVAPQEQPLQLHATLARRQFRNGRRADAEILRRISNYRNFRSVAARVRKATSIRVSRDINAKLEYRNDVKENRFSNISELHNGGRESLNLISTKSWGEKLQNGFIYAKMKNPKVVMSTNTRTN